MCGCIVRGHHWQDDALPVHSPAFTAVTLGSMCGCLFLLASTPHTHTLQSAMPVLAAAAPHLRRLNLSWIAMVNDWGLGQLSSLHNMQHLNLTATGEFGGVCC